MKSFDEEKKSLKLFFPCNQNTFCFCWLKWIFCRFKLSIHIFLSRLKSNLSWSELTRLEPEPEFFFSSTRTRPDPKKSTRRILELQRFVNGLPKVSQRFCCGESNFFRSVLCLCLLSNSYFHSLTVWNQIHSDFVQIKSNKVMKNHLLFFENLEKSFATFWKSWKIKCYFLKIK